MEKLNENLSLGWDRDCRKELNTNFHILNVILASLDKEEITKDVQQLVKNYDESIQRQIQAIIDPRYNEVSLEIEKARVDSRGVRHKTINDRINADIRRLEAKINGKSNT